jgi:hypothetical protein
MTPDNIVSIDGLIPKARHRISELEVKNGSQYWIRSTDVHMIFQDLIAEIMTHGNIENDDWIAMRLLLGKTRQSKEESRT